MALIEKILVDCCWRRSLHFKIRGRDYWIISPIRVTPFGRWAYVVKTKKGNSTGFNYKDINPIPKLKYRMWKYFMERVIEHFKAEHLVCPTCGEGLVKYSIKNPNTMSLGHKKRWFCCEQCVRFYDHYFDRRKIVIHSARR